VEIYASGKMELQMAHEGEGKVACLTVDFQEAEADVEEVVEAY
jgi:hypothetical protein